MSTIDLRGNTALVTGASAGIGEAYAEGLAARGCDLVLVARRRQRLEELAGRLTAEYGVRCHVIAVDLGDADAASYVLDKTRRFGIEVDVLVNNAGFATYGRIDDVAAARDRSQVLVNSASMVDLCHAFVPGMIERRHGIVLNLSSIAAFQAVPFMAVYGATKAFNLSFTEALWRETRGTGVRVMAVCPGATATEFFDVVGNDEETLFGKPIPASAVVDASIRALRRDRPSMVVGTFNRVTTWLPRLLPRKAVLAVAARQTAPSASTVVSPRTPIAVVATQHDRGAA